MTIVTSTLRMKLDAGGFVKSAAQLAEAAAILATSMVAAACAPLGRECYASARHL